MYPLNNSEWAYRTIRGRSHPTDYGLESDVAGAAILGVVVAESADEMSVAAETGG